jgi:hypothetical protein
MWMIINKIVDENAIEAETLKESQPGEERRRVYGSGFIDILIFHLFLRL